MAKEFVASRTDRRGALVLSRFTGAARELADALPVNPYDVDGFAEALRLALVMPEEEQERRMRRMRQQVADNNIYRWAGVLLSEAGKLVGPAPCPPSPNGRPVGAPDAVGPAGLLPFGEPGARNGEAAALGTAP